MNNYRQLLKQYWGYDDFRPFQEDIIKRIVEERKDVLAILPTGGGKSICYQVSALAMGGVSIIVSPLIALMKDQVLRLKEVGVSSAALYSGLTHQEMRGILELCLMGKIKMLYVSPERLQTELFLSYYERLEVGLIGVDEAHCVSQWGHDFRRAYLEIENIRKPSSKVPILALTASATLETQDDIVKYLGLRDPVLFKESYARAELVYRVVETKDKYSKLVSILKRVPYSGLVYCGSRKRCEEIVEVLNGQLLGADFYHAGLDNATRNKKQEAWMNNKIKIMVCTNAFGMGIDKKDVRVVVHYQMPTSIESYYQEAGRAGRDRQKSYAVSLFDPMDLEIMKKQLEEKYPSMYIIKKIYGALNNYYKIALGKGALISFDYEFEKVLPLLQDVPIASVLGGISILEQFDIIRIVERVNLPAKIWVCCDKHYFLEFQKNVPALRPLLDFLVRKVANIWHEDVVVNLDWMAKMLKISTQALERKLCILENARVINYYRAIQHPQIIFLINRVGYLEEYIDVKKLAIRKQKDMQRYEFLAKFVSQQEQCRSEFIGQYFGEKHTTACLQCDVCVEKRRLSEMKMIEEIKACLKIKAVTLDELYGTLEQYLPVDIKKRVEFLMQEKVIFYNEEGKIDVL